MKSGGDCFAGYIPAGEGGGGHNFNMYVDYQQMDMTRNGMYTNSVLLVFNGVCTICYICRLSETRQSESQSRQNPVGAYTIH